MRLHCPGNIKVHWAGAEVQNQYLATDLMGVNYHLYTAYPFVEKMIFKKGHAPIMPLKWQKQNPYEEIPQNIIRHNIHTIQDSGIFTLLYSAMNGRTNNELIARYYDALVSFTLEHASGATCVELDCQDLCGTELAWEYRERFRKDIPNRIINVWHGIDGKDGLDRLIEFADYIAIPVLHFPLRNRLEFTVSMANYIKTKKPSMDIHLLGCTSEEILKACRFCTSSDSTTWTGVKRFGYIDGAHQSRIKTNEVRGKIVSEEVWDQVHEYNSEVNTNGLVTNIEKLKREYENTAGIQDYFVNKRQYESSKISIGGGR